MWIDTEKIRFEDYSENGYSEDELMSTEEQAEFEAGFQKEQNFRPFNLFEAQKRERQRIREKAERKAQRRKAGFDRAQVN